MIDEISWQPNYSTCWPLKSKTIVSHLTDLLEQPTSFLGQVSLEPKDIYFKDLLVFDIYIYIYIYILIFIYFINSNFHILIKYLTARHVTHESDNYINYDWIIKGTGGLGNKRTSGDHPNSYIIENGQNTEKSPGDLRRPAVTQTSMKNHLLTLRWTTHK